MELARPQDDSRDDGLFDEYLERALVGDGVDPVAFCTERGLGAPPGWLLELHGLVKDSDRLAATRADAGERRLGDYVLVRRLGEGGMGVVYLAEDRKLKRHVALKTVRPELAGSPTALHRFDREARALARLRHPGIAAVHAYGEADGVRFLAMELILGRDLDQLVAEQPFEVTAAARVARDVAEALATAHTAGVLHRDVKPANIRRDSEGRAVLMDFGLARDLEGADPTLTAAFAGSPAYAAPEQLTGARPVDVRTDVYGLGATLYELLTGRVPFAGDNVEQIMRRVLSEDPVPLRRLRPEVPRDLEAVVLRALERDPERRYQSATAFAADLEAWLTGGVVRARPFGPVRRVRRWMRGHRAASIAIVIVLITVAAGSGALAVDGVRARTARRAGAAQEVDAARTELQQHGRARDAAEDARRKLRALNARLVDRVLNPREADARQRFTAAAQGFVKDRGVVFARVEHRLGRALELDPDSPALRRARAELAFHKWLDYRQTDPAAAALYFAQVCELDEAGDLAAKVLGVQRVELVSRPPGAEVHLFRVRAHGEIVAGGDTRLVPVGPGDVAPRGLVLRVEGDDVDLRVGDHITAVEGRSPASWIVRASTHAAVRPGAFWTGLDGEQPGGIPRPTETGRTFTFVEGGEVHELRGASLAALGVRVEPAWQFLRKRTGATLRVAVLRGEELLAFDVEPPLDVVPSAAAFVPTAATRIGATPIPELVLEPGSYHAVLRKPGYPDARLPFHVDHSVEYYSRPRRFEVELTKLRPAGFVHVPGEAHDLYRYFLQRTEVTNADYLRFVNARTQPGRWLPRRMVDDALEPAWPIVDGRAALPDGLDPELPVTGVGWSSAKRYASWYPRGHGLDETVWFGVLPAYAHLARAAHGGDGRLFVYGNYFNPAWTKSRHSRWQDGPEPGLSYPIDESPYGAFDLMGSVAEWAGDPTNPVSEGTRIVFGGSHADAQPWRFRIERYRTLPPGVSQAWVGFRVMLMER